MLQNCSPRQPAITCPWQTNNVVYLVQDFSTDICSWDKDDEKSHFIEVNNGQLQIFNTMPGIQVLSFIFDTPVEEEMLKLSEMKIEVEIQELNGNPDSYYGIICKAQYGFYDYYYAKIDGHGNYKISSLKGMQGQNQVEGTFALDNLDTHHLRLDCLQNSVDLYVDGQYIDSLPDNQGIQGMIGLFAESFVPDNYTLVGFDNLKISKP